MQSEKSKLGVALVGLGEYSSTQLGPALKETAHCYLAAVVSGDEAKRQQWQQDYNLKNSSLYNYENFDDIKYNTDVDIVYIVLPNSLHADFAVRAAMAGKHVIVEKPMALTIEQCERVMAACRKKHVRLSIGYRLHFEPFNQEMMRLGQNELFGKVKRIVAHDSQDVGEKNQWRLNKSLSGGGPLLNNGVYCVQAAQFVTGELPMAVKAAFLPKTDPNKFDDVEEGINWTMEFPGGAIAECQTSYSKTENLLRVECDNGFFELDPAYEYSGLKGRTSNGEMQFPDINQQAAQMDDFAQCIINRTETRVPGEMGLRDLTIMLAIYESARTNERITLNLQDFATLAE